MKTVETLKENVAAIVTGIDLDNVPDLYGSFQRAVSTFIQKADVPEASGRQSIILYDRVFNYLTPPTMFGGALIDIQQQGVTRQVWDDVEKVPIMRFDRNKQWCLPSGYMVTFEWNKGVGIMRVAQDKTPQAITLADMTSTDNWTVSATASGLAVDSVNYYESPASLRFLLGTGTGQLQYTPDNALSMADYEDVGVAFLAIQIPSGVDPALLTSIALRVGSSSANYNQVSVTTGFLGDWVAGEWLLVAFNFQNATQVGTPNWSAIDYIDLVFTAGGSITNLHIGSLWMALGMYNNVLFYSPAVFMADNTPSADITSDEDEILFHDASYNIYVQEAAREIAKNQGGTIASGLLSSIDLVLEGNGANKLGLYQQYRGDNPSEEIRQVGNYYYDE